MASRSKIIGREEEIQLLQRVWDSLDPEFLAVYGRRRIGKTHLVREFFSELGPYFECVGMKDGPLKEQLLNFTEKFSKTFFEGVSIQAPSSWRQAFELLTKQIQNLPSQQKITIFFDELPWLAHPKSGFIQALDYYWNSYWSRIPNLKLVVCGSAASWMLEKLINARGGLHNRLTKTLLLEPLTLVQTDQFLKARGIRINKQQVLNLYMVMGGVPHYLKQVEKGLSASQIIDQVCFSKNGILRAEFKRLFESLFDEASVNMTLVRELAAAGGLGRNALLNRPSVKALGLSSGGTFNKRLKELEASGFIQRFVPLGHSRKQQFFRVVDEYTLFYLRWIESIIEFGAGMRMKNYWQSQQGTGEQLSWAGLAFEAVCLKHADRIQSALELEGVPCKVGSWRFVSPKGSKLSGAQIDLLFDRPDGVITICEIKYSQKKFTIDKGYSRNLINKIRVVEEHLARGKQIFLAMITTCGVHQNAWSNDLVDQEVVLDDLFNT